jgi:hypothetical protein
LDDPRHPATSEEDHVRIALHKLRSARPQAIQIVDRPAFLGVEGLVCPPKPPKFVSERSNAGFDLRIGMGVGHQNGDGPARLLSGRTR